jgi:arylsulfatase A-like enzyme
MVSLVDDALGRVQNAAEQAGLRDNTVQIFTSDHGDHLGDHRLLFKGAEQYDAITHVPFIWTDPQQPRSGHSDELAQTIDIGTSILERANIEAPHGMQGQPLSIAGGGGRDCVLIHYDSQRPQQVFGEHPRAMTLIKDRWRLTIYLGDCRNELFDLADDPGEMHNLWDSPDHAGIRQQLVQRLAEEQMAVMDSAPLPVAEA